MEKLGNINELRSILWATVRGVRSRHVKPQEAKQVYAGTSQIMQSYKLEAEILKLSGRKMEPGNGNSFLPAPDKKK